jgi:O-antigen ligase
MNKKEMYMQQGRILFFCLLILLFWLPIPLASNRPWAWGLMNISSYLLLLSTVFVYGERTRQYLKNYKVPLGLLAVFVAYSSAQIVPLPLWLLQYISPSAAAIHDVAISSIGQNSEVSRYGTLSIDPAQSTISLFKTLSYTSLFVCTLLLCNSIERIRTMLLTITCIGVFQATYGTLEVLLALDRSLIFSLPVSGIASGTFVYKNHYANYLMLCLSMGVGYLVSTLLLKAPTFQTNHKVRNILETLLNGKALVRIALAIMVIALVMSRSRMGNTAFFVSMSIVGLLSLFLIKKRTRGLSILIISMFIIDMFILSAWFGLDKVKMRLEQTNLSQETRDEVIRDSLPLLQDFAFTGSGMGSFYGIFPKYQGDDINLFYDHAHNDYLQFAIEAGIPFTLLLFLLPILAMICCIKSIKHRRNPVMKGTAFGCLMVIIGMAIHMSVDFPLQAPANTALFMVLLALGFITQNRAIR